VCVGHVGGVCICVCMYACVGDFFPLFFVTSLAHTQQHHTHRRTHTCTIQSKADSNAAVDTKHDDDIQ